jgi:hypothetical protein
LPFFFGFDHEYRKFITGNFALPDARDLVPAHGDLFVAIQAARISRPVPPEAPR